MTQQQAEMNVAKVSVNADRSSSNKDDELPTLGTMGYLGSLTEVAEAMDRNDVLVLPDNIYTAAISLPMTRDQNSSGILNFWKNLQIFLLVASNIVAQAFLIGFIGDIYEEESKSGKCGTAEQNTTDTKLRAIAEAIFVGYCMIDLLETWNMHLWWMDMSRALPKEFWSCLNSFLNTITCNLCGFGFQRKTRFCNREGEEDQVAKEFAERIRECHPMRKVWVHFIIVLKYALTINLSIFGTGFLLLSETNSDLILNALALTFVLELDEMFYQFFLTTEMKVIVETFTPMVVVENDKSTQFILSNLTILARAGMLAGATLFMYSFYCTDFWENGKFNRG